MLCYLLLYLITYLLLFLATILLECHYIGFVYQQNAGQELNVLSAQWRELCLKNIEIEEACAKINNHLEDLSKEAAERWVIMPL